MREAEDARAYLQECFEPEVLDQPLEILRRRSAWRAGTFVPGQIETEPVTERVQAPPEEPEVLEVTAPVRRKQIKKSKTSGGVLGVLGVIYIAVMVFRFLFKLLTSDDL